MLVDHLTENGRWTRRCCTRRRIPTAVHAEWMACSLPADERPRERMARGGAVALSDAELIALLIEPGWKGKSSLDIAREVVADGLLAVAGREWIPGKAVGSLGASHVARIGAARELGRRIAALSVTSSEPIRHPEAVAGRLMATYGHRVQETFGGIYLDVRHRIISEREIFVGTLTSASVSPRDVFRFALNDHAAAVPDRDFECLRLVQAARPALGPVPDSGYCCARRCQARRVAIKSLDHFAHKPAGGRKK
jgi:DNA repair protein RadC